MLTSTLIRQIVRHVVAAIKPEYLRRTTGAVTAVASDGTCTVDCIWGKFSGLAVLQPWPECNLRFESGATVILAWPEGHGGKNQLPHIVGFIGSKGVSLEIFSGGALEAARKTDPTVVDDTTAASFIAWMAAVTTVCSAVDLTGIFATAVTTSQATPDPWPLTSVPGKITAGSAKIKLG